MQRVTFEKMYDEFRRVLVKTGLEGGTLNCAPGSLQKTAVTVYTHTA